MSALDLLRVKLQSERCQEESLQVPERICPSAPGNALR